ncbi:MAG: cytochrome c [Zoogloeaceae bacterium]|jgi:cytochrome c556|nr:cytochrome c [Zoogloeaceae bacterium]
MMKKFAMAAVALAFAASAQAQMKPEEAIKTRQAGYDYMAWSMGKIKANLEGQYNKAAVIQAANTINAIAHSGMGALYIPGSEKDVGGVKTAVKPEMFTQHEAVAQKAQALATEAEAMAQVASTGDQAAVKAQFGKLGGTCKSCHDDFKMKH